MDCELPSLARLVQQRRQPCPKSLERACSSAVSASAARACSRLMALASGRSLAMNRRC